MGSQFRRSAIYVMAGFICFAIFFCRIDLIMELAGQPLLHPNRTSQSIVATLCLVVAFTMVAPLRWRLIVDQYGVTRHRLVSRDLWTWSDFACGRIQKIYPWDFRDPQRPWWVRKLKLGHLAQEESSELTALINEVYRLPASPELPQTISFNYAWRRKFTLDESGILGSISGSKFAWAWSDVRRLRILQHEPLRRDFQELQLFVPDESIQLKLHGLNPSWRGASSEVVYEFLLSHLPREVIDFDITGERPSRSEDVEPELQKAKKQLHNACVLGWMLAICFTLLLVTVWFGGKLPGLLIVAFVGGLHGFVLWLVFRALRKEVVRLECWLAELQAEETTQNRLK